MFNFPECERTEGFSYERNLLKSSTFQVTYSKIENILEKESAIRSLLEKDFPNIKNLFSGGIEFKIDQKTPIVKTLKSSDAGLELKSQDGKKILSFTDTALTCTIYGEVYKNFESFKSEFKEYCIPLLNLFDVQLFNRFAIRKINLMESVASELDYPPVCLLDSAFNKVLIEGFSMNPGAKFVASGLSQTLLKNENYHLNLNYGLLPHNTAVEKRQLILDIDLYLVQENLKLVDLIPEWKKMNNEIFNIFHWAIKKELLEAICNKQKGINL